MTPLGVQEIAALLGVKRQTVSMWRVRGIFPPPVWHCSGVDLWELGQVIEWAQATGRETVTPLRVERAGGWMVIVAEGGRVVDRWEVQASF